MRTAHRNLTGETAALFRLIRNTPETAVAGRGPGAFKEVLLFRRVVPYLYHGFSNAGFDQDISRITARKVDLVLLSSD